MEKQIVWLDTETTSTDTNTGRIVQIAAFTTDIHFNKTSEVFKVLVNPETPIPPESTEVHGITDAMVSEAPKFSEVGPGLLNFIGANHIAGYNVTFDILMLMSEFARVKLVFILGNRMIIDPLVTLRVMEPRDQSTVYTYYTGKTLEGAHDAAVDIMATHEIALAQVGKYESINSAEDMYALSEPENRCDLAGKFKMKDGVPVFTFGKDIGKPISENLGMLTWMLSKDFPQDTKSWIESYLAQGGKQ